MLTLSLVFSAAPFFSIRASQAASATSTTSFSLGEISTPPIASLNPLNPACNTHLCSMLYDFLFSVNFPPLPFISSRMAAGYSVSDNNTHWVVNLRPNLKWSDGTSLNSSDLAFSLQVFNESGNLASPVITGWSIMNSTAVSITTQPGNLIFYDFIYNGVVVLPKETFGPYASNYTALSSFPDLNHIVADGAFVLSSYTAGQNPVVLHANPYYWQGAPHFQTLYYYQYSSLQAELNAYESGQIDMFSGGGTYTNYQPVANLPGSMLVGPPQAIPGHTFGILMNDWTYPFNITTVRRALAYATNVAAINQALNGPFAPNATENQDLLLPAYNRQIGFSNGTGPVGYSYNVTQAKTLFMQAGFKYSGSTLEYPNGTAVSFTIRYNAPHAWAASTATLISQQWQQVGISSQVIATPTDQEQSFSTQSDPVGWQVLVTPGLLNNWGVTPGPGIVQELGTYEVPVGGTETFWNSTYGQIYTRLETEQNGTTQFIKDAQACADLNAYDVPVIPLYNVFGFLAVKTSIYWGSPTQYTGIYNTQAMTNPEFWDETLYYAAPANATTTSGSSIASSSALSLSVTDIAIIAIVVIIIVIGGIVAVVMRRRPRESPPT
jgi:ABC-type transport system substrate-binding protein